MEQPQCVFCSIARKQTKSFMVYEDEHTAAFLDIMPRSRGMAIVIPKRHYRDFDEDEETSAKVFLSAEKVAHAVKLALNPLTVFISVYPSQIPHFHIKVYPAYENEVPLVENQPKQAQESELSGISQAISSILSSPQAGHPAQERPKAEEKPAEEKAEKKKPRSKEETYWIRRGLDIA